ncbi:MAG: Uma2 family endonuclease [Lacipirellulaceae bacterium]
MSMTTAKFTLEEYERMGERGVFEGIQRKRMELIRGEIVEMTPIGPLHNHEVDYLMRWSFSCVGNQPIHIRVQGSLRIAELVSEPEPDILWLREADYRQQHPGPEDVLLLIEVANASLADDRGEKLALYAEAGIADYWIVNCVDKQIEVYREPEGNAYKSKQVFRGKEAASPLVLASAKLTAAELFA